MKVRRGDVVLIVAAGELGKPRPAVVVQANKLGDETTAVVVCPMSSDLDKTNDIRPLVEPSSGTGIRLSSQIMTDKIVALPRHRIRGVIGHLDREAQDSLDNALTLVLGLG